ncbi:cytochrome P450 [Mycolicibacterium fluoranthenivorans]|uniref:Cytochrome P450 n=1 Tax=Mycolicibacterium fluoranthenivorans TaxID=258505 RepID=A0A7G8PKL4_9MYCO|nr:cytochrome P450 [Mycolicibacterium fluoranthenivorans]QNJ94880.1 cytochrome P450 [Mycolicibacterium fluoranthenivorans]
MTTPDTHTPPRLPWDSADPYPFYETLRRNADIVWDDTAQAWLILGYHAARTVLTDKSWTSDPRANRAINADTVLNSAVIDANMLFADGPTHHRLRSAVRDVFSRSFIDGLHTGVDAICHDVISAIPAGKPFDFMSQIALPLPIAVIGAWMELDAEQCTSLREHSPAIIRLLGGLTDEDDIASGIAASAALIADLLPAAADRRAHPGDDLLSFLAADPTLSLDEVVITALLVAVAGHETTANLLGAGLIRLLTPSPDGNRPADYIDASDPAVCTELLRLDAPVQATARTATADQTIAGVDIACGEAVLVCIAAANRDPAIYAEPNQFHPGRPGPAPLSFGHGAHYCLGAPLARLETSTALHHILARKPELVGTATWRDTAAIRGPLRAPAVLTQ